MTHAHAHALKHLPVGSPCPEPDNPSIYLSIFDISYLEYKHELGLLKKEQWNILLASWHVKQYHLFKNALVSYSGACVDMNTIYSGTCTRIPIIEIGRRAIRPSCPNNVNRILVRRQIHTKFAPWLFTRKPDSRSSHTDMHPFIRWRQTKRRFGLTWPGHFDLLRILLGKYIIYFKFCVISKHWDGGSNTSCLKTSLLWAYIVKSWSFLFCFCLHVKYYAKYLAMNFCHLLSTLEGLGQWPTGRNLRNPPNYWLFNTHINDGSRFGHTTVRLCVRFIRVTS